MSAARHASPWAATSPRTAERPAAESVSADVLVIGGGIAGLTAALLLQRAGISVAVIEMHRVGDGETGHTTAHLTELVDARYVDIERDFGGDGARLVADSSRAAMDLLERWSAEFPCDFARVPAFMFAARPEDLEGLHREVEAAQRAGVAAQLTEDVPLPFATPGAVRVNLQAQMHPLKYLRGVARALVQAGGALFENSRVVEVHDDDPCRVKLASGLELTARSVLVTAHVPAFNLLALHTKIAAYRTYAVAARVASFPAGLFWDTADPYHYVRAHADEQGLMLIVGGEDHKTGQNDDTTASFARLRQYATERFGVTEFAYEWSGQIIEPVDGLPYIGRNTASDNVFVATGFSGNGITFGTLAGMLLADAVRGRESPWAPLYEATRMKVLGAVKEMIVENVDFPLHLVGDRLASPTRTVEDLAPGEGAVVEVGGRKLAVYCDDHGALTGMSPVCTHMGCHVHWNTAEKSWDCPCHGGRFDAKGDVLNGPPLQPLARVPLTEPEPSPVLDDEPEAPTGATA